jgi:glycosyltransferase involved in cell wall biosynthesis
MMRIVVDLQAAQGPSRHRGIGRYAMALTQSLARNNGGGHEIIVALNGLLADTIDPIRAALTDVIPQENFLIWTAPGPVNAADPSNDARRHAAELMREAALASVNPDYVIATSLFEGFAEEIVTSVGSLGSSVPTAAVLYDLIPLIHKQVYLPNPLIERWYENKLAHLRNADLLLAISESSRREALSWIGSEEGEVVNISTAADDHFSPAPTSEITSAHLAQTYGLNRPFVMYTGGIDHRKNIEGLIEAFARLNIEVRRNHQLAIVCSVQEPERRRLLKLARDVKLAEGDVILTGFIPEDDLLACYRNCKLFVFPSWHEGFGLPALEAMKCGRAVIAADRAGLPEVVGLESALFDPFDLDAMSAKIQQVLTDDHFREALERHGLERARTFHWDTTARRAWDALEARHARSVEPSRAPQRRPRLAFVSPVTPEVSGISDYSAELLPELARHYRIDVITPTGTSNNAWIRGNCRILDVARFRQTAGGYDRVMYHFGNSQFHAHMFALLHDIPGVVVLHDFFLSGILAHLDNNGELPGAWSRALVEAHGWPAVVERYKAADPDQVIWNYPCNLSVLQDALGIIVHADYSRQLARQWYGDDAAADWRLIPHLRQPIPSDRARARRDLGIGTDDFVVCSFGHIVQTKMNHLLLEAWLASPLAKNPRCRLVFVGQSDGNRYCTDLERLARSPAAGGRVEITGWADQNKFRRWLHAADLAVQLRTLSRGETSGTVLDCMNAGVATIVNAHGAIAELPPDSVWMMEDAFTVSDLAAALETLWRNPERRTVLAQHGRAHIARNHRPRLCATAYADAIEHYYACAATAEHGLLRALLERSDSFSDADWASLSEAMAQNLPKRPRSRRLFIDVSSLMKTDLTAVGKVPEQQALLSLLLAAPPRGWAVEPVYMDGTRFRHARRFTSRFLNIPDNWCQDGVAEPASGDAFLDLGGTDPNPALRGIMQGWRRRGVGAYRMTWQAARSETGSGEDGWWEAFGPFDDALCAALTVAEEQYAHAVNYTEK